MRDTLHLGLAMAHKESRQHATAGSYSIATSQQCRFCFIVASQQGLRQRFSRAVTNPCMPAIVRPSNKSVMGMTVQLQQM